MKELLKITNSQPLISLASELVYLQKPFWCNATYKALKLSLLKPRKYYDYDPSAVCPVLIFLCGGALEQMDRNVWMGELSWFAKRGYAVACVEYSTDPRTKWPTQLTEIKQAIRFLRAHADELSLDPEHFYIAGESAGGFLALASGLSNHAPEYDIGEYLEQSSEVSAVIAWYPAVSVFHTAVQFHMDLSGMPDLLDWVRADAPPTMLLHGTADQLVPCSESEHMYDALCRCHVPADLILIEGAHHNDAPFVQECIKQRMLDFLNCH